MELISNLPMSRPLERALGEALVHGSPPTPSDELLTLRWL